VCLLRLPFCIYFYFAVFITSKLSMLLQEVEPTVGEALCRLFPLDENIDLRRIAQIARQSLRRKEGGGKSSASATRSVTDSSSPGVAESSSSRSDMLMLGLCREPMSASEADCYGCCLLVGGDDGMMTKTVWTSYLPERCRTFLERKSAFNQNSVVTRLVAC